MTDSSTAVRADVVIEADNLPEVVDTVQRLLRERNSGVYQRDDVVVGFVGDNELCDADRPYRLVVLDEYSGAQRFNRIATAARRNRKTGELVPVNLPPVIARTMFAERQYRFAELVAVVEHPIIDATGRLYDRTGYSDGLLLHFSPEDFPRDRMTRLVNPDDVDAAVCYLSALLDGFPFVDNVSRAVAIAALMTSVLRPVMEMAPGIAITAHAAGTGKTHLQRVIVNMATGRDVGVSSWPGDEIELRKALLAALMPGAPAIVFDNATGVIRSDALCAVLTSPLYQQRLLGGNETISVPTRALITITGNNLQLGGDLPRRFLTVRLDAGIERPERRAFKFDPLQQLRGNRPDYVDAVLTITRAYLASGSRPKDMLPLVGYDAWSRLVREPLVWAGLVDPVESVARAIESDPDRLQLVAMLDACQVLGITRFDVTGLVGTAKASHVLGDEDGNAKRAALRSAIEDIALRGSEINNRVLGRWLASVEGRIVGGRRFVRDGGGRSAAGNGWRIEQA